MIPKTKPIRDESYRRHVASQPCLICGSPDVQASHIRIGHEGGMGMKPGDDLVWPLCVAHHREFDSNQRDFLERHFTMAFLLKQWRRAEYRGWVG